MGTFWGRYRLGGGLFWVHFGALQREPFHLAAGFCAQAASRRTGAAGLRTEANRSWGSTFGGLKRPLNTLLIITPPDQPEVMPKKILGNIDFYHCIFPTFYYKMK